ncbi:hypothetical protein FGO68_gene13279 [Halteria grandinella]|uniref:Uncharacterized protein n=1 Tax=Halteria grandinella TaxID=5974 RepID=A0A8J8NF25_HALGN|nr:hypothetical protein FGO68_gene13279 [Halteria grandinella]
MEQKRVQHRLTQTPSLPNQTRQTPDLPSKPPMTAFNGDRSHSVDNQSLSPAGSPTRGLTPMHAKHPFDLDNYVELKSVSRCGRKFSPDKLLPRCEIIKMRPKLLQERNHQQMILKKLMEKQEREELDAKIQANTHRKESKGILLQLDKMQKTTQFKNFDKIKLLESGDDYNPKGLPNDFMKRRNVQQTGKVAFSQATTSNTTANTKPPINISSQSQSKKTFYSSQGQNMNETKSTFGLMKKSVTAQMHVTDNFGKKQETSAFLAVSRDHIFKNYHSQLKKPDLHPPPIGWYQPKYGYVQKRPQTNTFYVNDRFKDEPSVIRASSPSFDDQEGYDTSIYLQRMINEQENQSTMITQPNADIIGQNSQHQHESTVLGTDIDNLKDLSLSIGKGPNGRNTSLQHFKSSQNKSNSPLDQPSSKFTHPLLCMQFDKYAPRKPFVHERSLSPHEERFNSPSGEMVPHKYLPNFKFEKLTKRKSSQIISDNPSTGLAYDYQSAIEKVTPGSQYKKVLPFKREPIDYAKKNRVIDLKGMQAPKQILHGAKLRKQLNKEDDWLIVEMLMKTFMKKKPENETGQSWGLERKSMPFRSNSTLAKPKF